jgi:hypothetical protein
LAVLFAAMTVAQQGFVGPLAPNALYANAVIRLALIDALLIVAEVRCWESPSVLVPFFSTTSWLSRGELPGGRLSLGLAPGLAAVGDLSHRLLRRSLAQSAGPTRGPVRVSNGDSVGGCDPLTRRLAHV